MDNGLRKILEFVPTNQHGIFKALIAHTEIKVVDKRHEEWCYWTNLDHIFWGKEKRPEWVYVLEDFPQWLSKKMWTFGNVIIFVENKGPNGWLTSRVTILDKNKGTIYCQKEKL